MFLRKSPSYLRVSLISTGALAIGLLTGCSSVVLSGSGGSTSSSQVPSVAPVTSGTIVNSFTPGSASPISKTFFGMTIQNLAQTSSVQAPILTPFPQYSLSTLRLWDVVNWTTIEAESGTYDWSKMDGTIAVASQNGVSDFIFTFGKVPVWASTNPTDPCQNSLGHGTTGSCGPPDLAALDDFAKNVVQRYCGVVNYYEPWNEPNGAGWGGTDAQLLEVVQHIYTIAKDPANCGCANGVCSPNGGENPNSVLLPSTSNISSTGIAWMDTFLSTAGPTYPYADVASFHGYGLSTPEDAFAQVASFKSILSNHGLGSMDMWDTEASFAQGGQYSPADTEDQAAWLMRFHMAELASGVSRFIWYAYDNCYFGTLFVYSGCSNQDALGAGDTLTDPGDAYKVTQSWFLAATLGQCSSYNNGLWMCELTRSGGYTAWMLWSASSSSVTVTIPQDSGLTVYRDWQNNVSALPSQLTISSQPVLLESTDL